MSKARSKENESEGVRSRTFRKKTIEHNKNILTSYPAEKTRHVI